MPNFSQSSSGDVDPRNQKSINATSATPNNVLLSNPQEQMKIDPMNETWNSFLDGFLPSSDSPSLSSNATYNNQFGTLPNNNNNNLNTNINSNLSSLPFNSNSTQQNSMLQQTFNGNSLNNPIMTSQVKQGQMLQNADIQLTFSNSPQQINNNPNNILPDTMGSSSFSHQDSDPNDLFNSLLDDSIIMSNPQLVIDSISSTTNPSLSDRASVSVGPQYSNLNSTKLAGIDGGINNYLNPNTELSIPGQYSLPQPSNSNSANTSANNSRNPSNRNSISSMNFSIDNAISNTSSDQSFIINTNTTLPNSPYASSAIADEEFIMEDSQFLMPTRQQPHHVRSSSMYSDASSALNSPAFRAASPLLPVSRSPYLDSTEGIDVLENNTSVFTKDGSRINDDFDNGFSINEPFGMHNDFTNASNQRTALASQPRLVHHRSPSTSNHDLSSMVSFGDSPGSNGLGPQQSISPSAHLHIQSLPSSHTQQQVFAQSPSQQQHISTPGSIVTTPEITVEVFDDNASIYSESPGFGVPSPNSDIESFPSVKTEGATLFPPLYSSRRRSHSDSALDHHQDFSGGFYQNSQPGSNVSLASTVSEISNTSSMQGNLEGFLSPEAAAGDAGGSGGRGRRRKRGPRSLSQSSLRGDSLSPGRASRSGVNGVNGTRPRSRSRSATREHILEMASPTPGARRTKQHPSQHKCTKCDKTFTRAYNLNSHMRTHTNERPFKCSVCNKAFARQHDRKRHEDLHSGEKKYICSGFLSDGVTKWGCGHRFARLDALGRHFRTEVGRQCVKPLVEDDKKQKMMQQQNSTDQLRSLSIYNGNNDAPALTLSPPPMIDSNPPILGSNGSTVNTSGSDGTGVTGAIGIGVNGDSGGNVGDDDNSGNGGGSSNMSLGPGSSAGEMFPQALLQQFPMLANFRFDATKNSISDYED